MALFLAFLTSGFSTLIILFILAIFMLLNQDIKIPASRTFHAALIVLLLIMALDFGDDLFAGRTSYHIQTLPIEKIVQYRTITSTLLYMLRPVVILLQLMIVAPSQRIKIPCITLALINAAVYAPRHCSDRVQPSGSIIMISGMGECCTIPCTSYSSSTLHCCISSP